MENLDVMVLRALRAWRADGHRALLATVVRTWGSSPRPIGSIMALCDNGAVVGSVSGGCIEDDLIDRYTQACRGVTSAAGVAAGAAPMPSGGLPQRVKYGVTADEAHRFGLPCGGTLELVLEFDPAQELLDDLLAALEAGRMVRRITDLDSGAVRLEPLNAPEPLHMDDATLVNSFGPEYRLLIIGAGQLSEYLATMALFSGFSVTVCDPREEYAGAWSVAQARLVREMPDEVVQSFRPDRRSAVVALTHDPKLDDLALLEALDSDAFYVGAIGSRRNHAARRERMIEHFGQTEESLARLRGPIGLYIGSKTPPEIAVSIMAEILAVKNGVALPATVQVGPAKESLAQPGNDADMRVCGTS